MRGWIAKFFGRELPADPYRWHPWRPLFSVRLADGVRSIGTAHLRRRKNRFTGRWDYEQDRVAAIDDWQATQW